MLRFARPLTRSTLRNGTTQNDTFGYNSRSELTSATLGSDNYAYAFDNIGNRSSSTEASSSKTYVTNNCNQYQAITEVVGEQTSFFPPDFDADGNAVLVYTKTGVWVVTYNGANRPIRFRNDSTDTTVECGYDSQGRRYFKKVTVAGTVTLHHRYIYRGYLQIACVIAREADIRRFGSSLGIRPNRRRRARSQSKKTGTGDVFATQSPLFVVCFFNRVNIESRK